MPGKPGPQVLNVVRARLALLVQMARAEDRPLSSLSPNAYRGLFTCPKKPGDRGSPSTPAAEIRAQRPTSRFPSLRTPDQR